MTFAMPTRVKCLLVDDLEENLLALAALLRRDDVEVLTARSGARRWSCCWRTTSRWRCSTCRCRTWTASSSPS